MTASRTFRAAEACEIVCLDRVKFNDAVISGAYQCAPPTRAGSARLFTEADLVPLYFFARLTEFGLRATKAGKLAHEINIANATGACVANIPAHEMPFGFCFCIGNVREIIADACRSTHEETRA